MKIPIFNSIYYNNPKKINTKKLGVAELNNLSFKKYSITNISLETHQKL